MVQPTKSLKKGASALAVILGLMLGLCVDEAHAAGPSIRKGPWVQRVTTTSAIVRVEVDPPAPVTIDLEPAEQLGESLRRTFESSEVTALHSVTLTGLRPATRYTYAIHAGVATKAASFATALPDESEAPFHFLVYGDNRTDDPAHSSVIRAMVPVKADFLVHTGDFVEDGSSSVEWQRFFDLEAPLLGARCIYSTVGNHELIDGVGLDWMKYFGPSDLPAEGKVGLAAHPELRDGTFRWGNTRFFLLNGRGRWSAGPERAWLESALKAADAEKNLAWRVVVIHHGPWSSGPHGGNTALHEAGVIQLLKAHHVDLVLAGHDHLYERGIGEDLPYVISGGGGAPTYKARAKQPQTKTLESVRHFVDVAVSRSSLQVTAIRADGITIERCALAKELRGWDCDNPPGPPPATEHVAPPPTTRSRCKCDAVGFSERRSPAPFALALAVGVLIARRRRAFFES